MLPPGPVSERALRLPERGSNQAHPEVEIPKEELIIRVTAHHRKDLDEAVVTFDPGLLAKVHSWLQVPPPSAPEAGIPAHLDQLPLEIACEVLRFLDVGSILDFRQVSRSSHRLVSTLPEYQAVTKHATNLILALSEMRLAFNFTLVDIQRVLATKNCSVRQCDQFGRFVFLPTLQRCCLHCLLVHQDFNVYRTNQRSTGNPTFFTIAGSYGYETSTLSPSTKFDYPQSYSLATEPSRFPRMLPFTPGRCMAAVAVPYVGSSIEHGVCCTGCQMRIEKNLLDADLRFDISERIYSHEGFLKHFRKCRQAKDLWKTGRGGNFPTGIRCGIIEDRKLRLVDDDGK